MCVSVYLCVCVCIFELVYLSISVCALYVCCIYIWSLSMKNICGSLFVIFQCIFFFLYIHFMKCLKYTQKRKKMVFTSVIQYFYFSLFSSLLFSIIIWKQKKRAMKKCTERNFSRIKKEREKQILFTIFTLLLKLFFFFFFLNTSIVLLGHIFPKRSLFCLVHFTPCIPVLSSTSSSSSFRYCCFYCLHFIYQLFFPLIKFPAILLLIWSNSGERMPLNSTVISVISDTGQLIILPIYFAGQLQS